MRKLRIIEHLSLDGVIQHSTDDGDFPYSDWTVPYRAPLAAMRCSHLAVLAMRRVDRLATHPVSTTSIFQSSLASHLEAPKPVSFSDACSARCDRVEI